ncbi:MAG: hypothetical protein JO265_00445, partial [Acidimicrobiia bacterium]|nr:hypothetical protein [Acidimicrobiia bacterium]
AVASGGQSVLDIHAVADGTPSAKANAIGGAGGIPGALHIGGGTSTSQSFVKDDGTVVTTAVASLHDVTIGNLLAPLLTIGTMTSSATVEVPFGAKPNTSLTVQITGALVSGTPVTITDQGITVANSVAVPASGLQQVNQVLAELDQYGISVRAVPTQKELTDTEGTVSGAALQFQYIVPPQVSLPTDIGKNETLLLGEVVANAAGRPRVPIALGALPTEVSAATATSTEAPLGTETAAATPELTAPTPQPAVLGGPSAAPAVAPASSGAPPFQLAPRSQNVVADRMLSGYRFIILVAVLAAAVYLLRNRTRLPE